MKTLIFAFLFFPFGLLAQISNDSINRYTDNHKKTGLWMVYLDEYTNEIEKEKAVFFGYELYDNGECVYPFAHHTGLKKMTVEFDGTKGKPGEPVVLNGTLKLVYSSGLVSYVEQYSNGRPLTMKAFRYDKQDVCCMKEVLDFQNQYNGTDGTFYYQIFSYDDKLTTHGYYRKGDKGWQVYDDEK